MSATDSFLLKGDLSGIQDFIFNVSSKGAAKSLKSRSYLVQVMGALACQFVYHELKNQQAKVFYNGGGCFYLTFAAENNTAAKENVYEIQKELNKDLKHDELAITLTFVAYTPEHFKVAWNNLRKASNEQKLRSYQAMADFFDPFDAPQEDTDTSNGIREEVKEKLKSLGFDLQPNNNLFGAITTDWVKNDRFRYRFFQHTFDRETFDGSLSNKLPIWKHYAEKEEYAQHREVHQEAYFDNYKISDAHQNIIDFDALGDFAAHRTGTYKIGVLKLDIDNLGQHFGKKEDYDQAKKLSKCISTFFEEELYTLYKANCFCLSGITEKYEANLYPIFAGGDDCFIIGGWDAVLCFARDLHQRFTTYFTNVDYADLTLSAGLVLVHPSHPVRTFSEMAEAALSHAKTSKNSKGIPKNAISIFGLRFSWPEYDYVLDTSKMVRGLMEDHEINRGYLDKLRKSARGFNALQNSDGADFNKIYKLRYYISRQSNVPDELVDRLFEPYYQCLSDKLLHRDQDNSKEDFTYDTAVYPTIARITELLTKTKLSYDRQK